MERTRDLFEQALEQCPAKFCKPIYLMYAQLEEEHGLAKRAMSVYERATQAVAPEDRFEVCMICVFETPNTDITYSDVYYIYRESCRKLRASCHSANLRASTRSLARQANGEGVHSLRPTGAETRRNRPRPSHLRSCLAVLRSARHA